MTKIVVDATQAGAILVAFDAGGYQNPVFLYTLDYSGNVLEIQMYVNQQPTVWIQLTTALDLTTQVIPIFNNLSSSQFYQVTAFTQ